QPHQTARSRPARHSAVNAHQNPPSIARVTSYAPRMSIIVGCTGGVMPNTLRTLLVICAAAVGSSQVQAQGVVMQRNLSLGLAKTIAEAALAECQAKGFHTSVVVVDRAGQIMVLLRDEQASAQTGEMARRKAYTA